MGFGRRDMGSTHTGPWAGIADRLLNGKTSVVVNGGRLGVDKGSDYAGLSRLYVYISRLGRSPLS